MSLPIRDHSHMDKQLQQVLSTLENRARNCAAHLSEPTRYTPDFAVLMVDGGKITPISGTPDHRKEQAREYAQREQAVAAVAFVPAHSRRGRPLADRGAIYVAAVSHAVPQRFFGRRTQSRCSVAAIKVGGDSYTLGPWRAISARKLPKGLHESLF